MAIVVSDVAVAFDAALAAALVGCAVAVVTTADTFKATVLFIVFGVMMAVAWGRLGAVDIALAEAAIGAGITGALLLHAQGVEGTSVGGARAPPPHRAAPRRRASAVAAIGGAAVFAVVALSLAPAPRQLPGFGPAVAQRLDEAGADNPVTAVLLNIRAYDTLLEIVVLLAAVIAAWSLALPRPPPPPPPGLILRWSTRVIVPITVLIGGYLLWRGARAPGGAFQAGAMIAGAGILAALASVPFPTRRIAAPVRAALALGTIVFVAAGALGLARGEPFLYYRGDAAKAWILAVEIAATISIALALVAVFIGRGPETERQGGAT